MGICAHQRRRRGQTWRPHRPRVEALYLSCELDTALTEYRRTDSLMPPALMVSYRLNISRIVDFRDGLTGQWDPLWQDFYCDWRRLYFHDEIEPPRWVIGDRVLAAGDKGILFRSVATGGTNLVLFTDVLRQADSITAHDPNHALPKNQDSWT